jgi:sensor histidine kinase YesM
MKNYTNTEKILPFILAILLPSLNFLANNSLFEQQNLLTLIRTWIASSFFLIILWYANEWFSYKNGKVYYLKAVPLNIGLALVFIILIYLILPDDFNTSPEFYWIRGLRVVFGSVIFITIQQSLKSAKTVEKLKSENLSLKTEKYKAELDQLRKQVNPHFLFNSLSTLRTMIRNSHPNSESFVLNLSSLYRQTLETHNEDYISLEEEMKFLNSYIYLMNMRHEGALNINIDINPQSFKYSIPIFALQILVENCIKHNIVSINKPLDINIYQKDEVTITVSNKYQPKQNPERSEGVGLKNLSARYNLKGIKKGLEIDKTESYYNVTLKLF